MDLYRSQLLYKWAKDIPDEQVWPVFVPSYNRPEATLLKRLFSEPEFPIILCIRREQEEMYKAYQGKCPILLLDNVTDISETREAIVQAAAPYYENIFMFDDDISWLDYMIPSLTKNGKESMRPSRTCFGEYPRGIDILKMWMASVMFDKSCENIALSSIGYKPDNWSPANANKRNSYNSAALIQCIHINTNLIRSRDIHYKPMKQVGAEDYAFQFDIMEAGLLTTIYKDLMYDCPAINSHSGGCEGMLGMDAENRYKMCLEASKQYYGNHPGIKYTVTKRTGFETVKFNWNYWRKE